MLKSNAEEEESKWEKGRFVHRQLFAQLQYLEIFQIE